MTSNRLVGKVDMFIVVKLNDVQLVTCLLHRMDRTEEGLYLQPGLAMAAQSADVLGALIWCEGNGRIRVVPPTVSATWSLPQ